MQREIEKVKQEYEEKQKKKKAKKEAKADEKDKKKEDTEDDGKAEKERDEKVSVFPISQICLLSYSRSKLYKQAVRPRISQRTCNVSMLSTSKCSFDDRHALG